MVVQDLTAAEYKQMALDLLVRADDALMARDYDSISPTLWSAVEHAVAAAAVERGWAPPQSDEKDELLEIVKRIDEERDDDPMRFYRVVSSYYDNNLHAFVDDYEFEYFVPTVRQFITKLLKLYGWNIRDGRTTRTVRYDR